MKSLLLRSLGILMPMACVTLQSFHANAADQDFRIGATTHFAQSKGIVEENLSLAKQAGMNSIRDEGYWGLCEREKGKIEVPMNIIDYIKNANSLGLDPLFILDGSNKLYDGGGYPKSGEAIDGFARYSETVAKTLKGRCSLFQVWNEWDGGSGMTAFKGQGDAKSYVKLQSAVYSKLKAVDPAIVVVANSVCTGEKFLEETLKEGVLNSCDGIAFHSYEFDAFGPKRSPEAYFAKVESVDRLIKGYNGGKSFPLYLTETGWPNFSKRGGSTEQESGDYIARTYLLVKTIPAVKGLWWYDFQDDGLNQEDPECNFGLVRTNLTMKEPYCVLRSIAEIVKKGAFVEKSKSPVDGLVILKFKMPDGRIALAAWCALPETDIQVTLKNSQNAKGPFKMFTAGFEAVERKWGARDWAVNGRGVKSAQFIPDRFQFSVRSRPCIIIGDLDGVEIEKAVAISFPDVKTKRVGHVNVPERILQIFPTSKTAPAVDFGGFANYRALDNPFPFDKKDIGASFSLSYDKEALNLSVEVIDDVFCQKESGANTWKGDSIQVALQNLDKNANQNGFCEYTLALTEKGPSVYREFSQVKLPEGPAQDVKLEVKRDAAKTVYKVRIPFKELGIKGLKPDALLGFSILVNDNDGKARKGYLHWGDGIGTDKNPYEYNWIMVKE